MNPAASSIAALRDRWAVRFIDEAAVTRLTDRGTFNETTLKYDAPTNPPVYSGPALFRPAENIDRSEYGERLTTGTAIEMYVPHDAATFNIEDVVDVTVCGYDPTLVGKQITIVGWDQDSYLTRRRVVCRLDLGSGYAD